MQPAIAAGSPAVCVHHPDQAAVAVCSRCGGFVCHVCQDYGSYTTCPSCRERTGEGAFPLSRDSWSVGELMSRAWAAFTANWLMLSLAMLVTMAISWAVSLAGQPIQVALMDSLSSLGPAAMFLAVIPLSILQTAVQGPLTLGFIRMAHAGLMGQRSQFGDLFGQFGKIFKLLGVYLLSGLVAVAAMLPLMALVLLGREHIGLIIVAFLVLIVPMTWLMLPLYFAQYELALDDSIGPVEAVKNAFTIAKGQRMAIFGVLLLAGLIAMVGFFALCVGILASVALGQVIALGLYLALRNGSGLPTLYRS